MAIFRGTALYMRAADQDQAWGTNVRALLGTAGADTNFTVTFTSTTTITQTVNPFTNISNVSADNRTNLGWALNESSASTDSMGSTSTNKRIIPAGNWSFGFDWTSNAPALLASYDVIIDYSVYRVATGGGTRTLLFTATAATVTVTLVAGSGTGAASSTQPEYIIQAGETIHVAVRITSEATSSILGGTTNTVITCTGATSGSFTTTLPTPGLRNLVLDSSTSTGTGVGTTATTILLDLISATGAGSGTISKLASYYRLYNATGVGTGSRGANTIWNDYTSTGVGSGTRTLTVHKDTISATGVGSGTRTLTVHKDTISATGVGSGSLARLLTLYREFASIAVGSGTRTLTVHKDTISAIGAGTSSISRKLDLFREFLSTGDGSGTTATFITKDIRSSTGVGSGTIAKSSIYVRQLIGNGIGTPGIVKSVIFVRGFNSTGVGLISPRIALDWSDLPDAGGGTTITLFPKHRIVNK